jgi:hypothetical protein
LPCAGSTRWRWNLLSIPREHNYSVRIVSGKLSLLVKAELLVDGWGRVPDFEKPPGSLQWPAFNIPPI